MRVDQSGMPTTEAYVTVAKPCSSWKHRDSDILRTYTTKGAYTTNSPQRWEPLVMKDKEGSINEYFWSSRWILLKPRTNILCILWKVYRRHSWLPDEDVLRLTTGQVFGLCTTWALMRTTITILELFTIVLWVTSVGKTRVSLPRRLAHYSKVSLLPVWNYQRTEALSSQPSWSSRSRTVTNKNELQA